MLEAGPVFFAFAVPAVVFAGVSKGGFGSGAAFAGVSILALIVEPGQALALMLPLLMLIDVAALKPYWRRWNGGDALLLILGGLPGVALGAWLFSAIDGDAMRLLIGGLSVAFVIWQLRARFGWVARSDPHMRGSGRGIARRITRRITGLSAGATAGFTSFVSHAGGPPVAVYLLSRGRAKTEYQATTVLVFWVLNLAKAVPYASLGLFSAETLTLGLMLAPFALFGTWAGVRLHHHIPEGVFFAIAYVLLTVTGAKLIWDGLA
ncbi:sulfite exporter TauE/SafE family protein [Phaeobacter sp. QD34_3]|uniref:sulfite exporter TauE/SafE family protein n=1 Tax=unclassified Phaeobacter TaxID=2621772 RepID=UPI00237F8D3E|nr:MULTISPECIES: sulfite exporter TauE/SafE family protein [unclassified Phaeobacter]MDE4132888.1 sulfite exporter TauE/SafE family protein [Phaeobacter sp. QD34_3]MDE4136319.1 sulfite exporter TauE/SafE family protein [Phaeobacter sp. QD34_24]